MAIFFMGVALLHGNGFYGNIVAVVTPTILAGIETLIVMTVLSHGSVVAVESELISLLQVQAFMLAMVTLILFGMMLVALVYSKLPKNTKRAKYPIGEH